MAISGDASLTTTLTTLAPRRRMRTALVEKSVLALAPAQNRLPPRWIGSNGRLCHRVFTAAATDAPVAAISPPAAHAVRATPALVGACDGALQACLWRWGPPNEHWRLLGR